MVVVRLGKLRTSRLPAANESAPAHRWCDASFVVLFVGSTHPRPDRTMRHQHSIARTCEVQGRGYWSGQEVTVRIHPADADHGIVLVRDDLPGKPNCPAHIEFQSEQSLRTNLIRGQARFEMVEHLMAALSALQIDNARIEIDGWEFPGLDGSSLAYVEALSASGLILQSKPRRQYVVRETFRVGDGKSWVQAGPPINGDRHRLSSRRFEYQLSYDDHTPIPPQAFAFQCKPSTFIRSVAPARTFVTAAQADAIRATGAATHVTDDDLIVIDEDGNPRAGNFRFPNECARHKTLDMVGDLALAGVEVVGNFTSFRGGHVLNGRMAKRLATLACGQSFVYKRKTA